MSRSTGFVFAAYACFVTKLGTTLPTPLHPLLQEQYSFGELVVIYIDLSFPVIAAGVAIHETSLKTAGIAFCAGVSRLMLGVLVNQLRSTPQSNEAP